MQLPTLSANTANASIQFGARHKFNWGTEGRANTVFQKTLAPSNETVKSKPERANFKIILEPDSSGNMTVIAQNGSEIGYADGQDAKGFLDLFMNAVNSTAPNRLMELWEGFWLSTPENDFTEALSNLPDVNRTV